MKYNLAPSLSDKSFVENYIVRIVLILSLMTLWKTIDKIYLKRK